MIDRQRKVLERAYNALVGNDGHEQQMAAIEIQALLSEPQPCKCINPAYCELNDRCSRKELEERGLQ